MKKLLLFYTAFTLFAFASIQWRNDFKEAYKESLECGKPLFVFIERLDPPCRWCQLMKRTTLSDPKIERFVNEHFVAVKLDRATSDYPDELYPNYVPTIYIIQGEKILKKIVGYWPSEDFWSDLRDIERLLARSASDGNTSAQKPKCEHNNIKQPMK